MQRFKNILCVVEPDYSCKTSLDRACELAESNQADLTVAAIAPTVGAGIGMPDGAPIAAELQAAAIQNTQDLLDEAIKDYRLRSRPLASRILVGTPFLEVIREVQRRRHDLLIKLPERQDWLDRLFGSDDMHLLRKCPCPVWLIKPNYQAKYRTVLAAVDVNVDLRPEDEINLRGLNQQIIEMAGSLALADFAALHIVHAWDAIGEDVMRVGFISSPESKINQYVEATRRRHADSLTSLIDEVARGPAREAIKYLQPQRHLIKGSARKEIPILAREIEADVVVMGTVARAGVSGFIMGNTAETILNQLDCSVLAIKPPGFVSPVRP